MKTKPSKLINSIKRTVRSNNLYLSLEAVLIVSAILILAFPGLTEHIEETMSAAIDPNVSLAIALMSVLAALKLFAVIDRVTVKPIAVKQKN